MHKRSALRIAVGAACLMPLAAFADESLGVKFPGGAADAPPSSATTWAAYMPVTGLAFEGFVFKFSLDVPDTADLADAGFVSKFAGGDPDGQASATRPGTLMSAAAATALTDGTATLKIAGDPDAAPIGYRNYRATPGEGPVGGYEPTSRRCGLIRPT